MRTYDKIDLEEITRKAQEYVNFCLESTKEVPTSGGVRTIRERHIPTIMYFLLVWMPRQDVKFYKLRNYYKVLSDQAHPAHETVKEIDEIFRALAADIVANEGKGIFYAKNLLGWTDRAKTEEKQEISITYENRPTE
jgi:uncharacterized membrane-anchored protein